MGVPPTLKAALRTSVRGQMTQGRTSNLGMSSLALDNKMVLVEIPDVHKKRQKMTDIRKKTSVDQSSHKSIVLVALRLPKEMLRETKQDQRKSQTRTGNQMTIPIKEVIKKLQKCRKVFRKRQRIKHGLGAHQDLEIHKLGQRRSRLHSMRTFYLTLTQGIKTGVGQSQSSGYRVKIVRSIRRYQWNPSLAIHKSAECLPYHKPSLPSRR